MDIPCLQNSFSRKKNINNNINSERLDRAIASQDINSIFPHGITYFGTISDHAPIIYDSKSSASSTRHLRFQNYWTLESFSHNTVRIVWSQNIRGSRFHYIQQN